MSEDEGKVKTCRKCGQTLPLTEFFRHSHYPDGYRAQCKQCHRAGIERVTDDQRPKAPCACGCGELVFTIDRRGRSRDRVQGHNSAPLAERLWGNVNKTETCWLWQGAVNQKGYGAISATAQGRERGVGHTQPAHRVAWELTNGPIPDGLHVLHHCDVKNCVRPDHLYLGTNDDNVRDAQERNRYKVQRGEDSPRARLTCSDVKEIRRQLENGSHGIGRELAKKYGISAGQVSSIRHRKTWGHLE